jgi:hypothetical protein
MNGQLHAPAALPPGKKHPDPYARWLGGPQSRAGPREENSWPYRDSNSDPSVVQPTASHYTDYAIPTPLKVLEEHKISIHIFIS